MWTLELANSIVVFVGVHTGVRALWMVIAILRRRLLGRGFLFGAMWDMLGIVGSYRPIQIRYAFKDNTPAVDTLPAPRNTDRLVGGPTDI